MKLSKKALAKLSDNELRLKLALRLGFTEAWIRRVVKANKSNGPLTTKAALLVIAEETRLTEDEILLTENAIA